MKIPRKIRRGISLAIIILLLLGFFFFLFSKTSGTTGSVTYIERLKPGQQQETQTLQEQQLRGEGPYEIEGLTIDITKVQREQAVGKGSNVFRTNQVFYIIHLDVTNNNEKKQTIPEIMMQTEQGNLYGGRADVEAIFENILPAAVEGMKTVSGFHVIEVPLEESPHVAFVSATTKYIVSK